MNESRNVKMGEGMTGELRRMLRNYNVKDVR